jgi:hypothetical protein
MNSENTQLPIKWKPSKIHTPHENILATTGSNLTALSGAFTGMSNLSILTKFEKVCAQTRALY